MAITTQIVSDINRDGLGIELIDNDCNVIAEIFRYDKDHMVIISIFNRASLKVYDLEEFIIKAKRELHQFDDGTPLPNDFTFANCH